MGFAPGPPCCKDNGIPGDAPEGTKDLGSYHSHSYQGGYRPGWTNDEFSPDDKQYYYQDKSSGNVGYLLGVNEQGEMVVRKWQSGANGGNQFGRGQPVGIIKDGKLIVDPAFKPDLPRPDVNNPADNPGAAPSD